MNEADQPRAHPAETAMDRAWSTLREARDTAALAALALLGDAVPARFPDAHYLHVADGRTAPDPVRVTRRDGAALKTFTTAEVSEGGYAALLARAAATVAALDAAADSVQLTRRETSGSSAGLCINLSACARLSRDVPVVRAHTVVGAWNRPEEIPGCQDREPVDDFIEHVVATNPDEAAEIALERQRRTHLAETAPTEAGYGMEPHAIAVFPLRVWPSAH